MKCHLQTRLKYALKTAKNTVGDSVYYNGVHVFSPFQSCYTERQKGQLSRKEKVDERK
jgi:hypothetical protein